MTDVKALIARVREEPGHPFCPLCLQDDYKLLAEALEIALGALDEITKPIDHVDGAMAQEAIDRIAKLGEK